MTFVPLIVKTLQTPKTLSSFFLFSWHGLALAGSVILFFVVGFQDQEVFLLRFDAYSSLACVLVALASFQSLFLFGFNFWIDRRQLAEILFLFTHGILGLFVFSLAQNLIVAFIGLEITSLILYIVLAMSRKDLFCLEASIKYFVLSSLAGAVFLYGLSFLYGAVGSLELGDFFASIKTGYNRFFFLGMTMIFVSLFFKAALFPFQFLLADVYQGALTPLTGFMSTALKSAIVLFIGKLFALPFFTQGSHGEMLISALAGASVLTLLFGNIMALKQTQLKRLVAFSSIAHSGYLMMALAGILSLTEEAKNFSPIFYYLFSYVFMTGGFLTVIQCLESKSSSQVELKDLTALFYRQPWLASALGLFSLALAGLPPTFGFFAKVSLFQPLVLSENWWMLFWLFIGSALGLYYYMKPLVEMTKEQSSETPSPLVWSFLPRFLLLFTGFGVLFGSIFLGFFL